MSNAVKVQTKKYSYTLPLLILFFTWIISTGLSWFAPRNEATLARYKITARESQMLSLKIAIPVLFIWLVAMYSATALNYYAKAVRKSREGEGYKLLSRGIYILVFQLVASTFINVFIAYHQSSGASVRVFSVYESAIITSVAFITLAFGAWKLVSAGGFEKKAKQAAAACLVLVALISWFYVKTILANEFRGIAPTAGSQATFGVSDTLIFTTIVPLYLVSWFAGLTAICNVLIYKHNVSGAIFKSAFRNFALGFTLLIGMSVFLQFLSQAAAYFAKAGLNNVVNIVYGLLVAIVLGYIFIATGAKKLLKLETTV